MAPIVGVIRFDDSEMDFGGAEFEIGTILELGQSIGFALADRWEISGFYLYGWGEGTLRVPTVVDPAGVEQDFDFRTHTYGAVGSLLISRGSSVLLVLSAGAGGLTYDPGSIEVFVPQDDPPGFEIVDIDFVAITDPILLFGAGIRWMASPRLGLQVGLSDRLQMCERASAANALSLCPEDGALLHHVALSSGGVLTF